MLPNFSAFGIGAIMVIAAAAAVGEEFFFRVFLQNWIASAVSPLVGIVVSSLAFGLMHALSATYFFLTLALALLIGSAYAWNGSITMIVCWHFSYDLLSLLALVKSPRILRLAPPTD